MNNPLAFPQPQDRNVHDDYYYLCGMTLRDYFAAKALQGMLCNGFMPDEAEKPEVKGGYSYTKAAFNLADKMLKAREQ